MYYLMPVLKLYNPCLIQLMFFPLVCVLLYPLYLVNLKKFNKFKKKISSDN